MAQPIFSEYIGKYQIKAIEFERLSLGTLPPVLHGEYAQCSSASSLNSFLSPKSFMESVSFLVCSSRCQRRNIFIISVSNIVAQIMFHFFIEVALVA